MSDDDPHPKWIDRVVDVAVALGMNGVRVRWKLVRWSNARRHAARRREQAIDHVKYEHAVCPRCHAVNARDEAACTRCGAALRSRPRELLGRLGFDALSPTVALAIVIIACYVRTALAGHDWLSLTSATLAQHGANLPRGAADDEWWRYLTSTLLHVGMWHIGFNLLALAVVGPRVERAYGALGMPLVFVVTGVCASIASQLTGLDGTAAGASGALMGLMGAIAADGHRSGTTIGRHERNAMLRWAAYTIIFGFGIGADNRAHLGGFLAGAAIGFAIPRDVQARRAGRIAINTLGALASIAIVIAAVLVMTPPRETRFGAPGGGDDDVLQDVVTCYVANHADQDSGGACERVEVLRARCTGRVPAFLASGAPADQCRLLRLSDQSASAPRD